MFLTLSAGEITGLIGAVTTIFTVFIVPIYRNIKKKKKMREEELERQKQRDIKIDALYNKISDIDVKLQDNCQKDIQIKETLDSFKADYESFSTQNLKFMINDAYLSYASVHDIPEEILINACECCEIYVNKRHLNHEIHPRCEILWKERERRAISKKEVDDE